MDRASKIAQEAVHFVVEQSRMTEPPEPMGPMAYEASFAMYLRKYFPQTKRKAYQRKKK